MIPPFYSQARVANLSDSPFGQVLSLCFLKQGILEIIVNKVYYWKVQPNLGDCCML